MQNAFIARLLKKRVPTETPGAKVAGPPLKEALDATAGRFCEESTPDAPLSIERDPLHLENDLAPTSREIHHRPRLGSMARPAPVRARRLIECPYHTCGGDLAPHPHGLYECRTCREWFELLPPEDLGEGDSHSFTLSGADGYKFVTTPDIRRAAERHRLRAMGDSEVGDDDSASDAAEWVM